VLGSLVSIVASLLVVLGVAPAGYPLIQVSLGLQAVLWGYAVLGQQLLQIVPAVAEIGQHAVFDNLDDGLLVVDSDGVVVRTNPRAGSYLDDRELTGESIESVLSVMDVETIQDLPTRFEHDRQSYQADASQIRNWRGEQIGHTVVIRDVGQLVTREQRLAVLNRILRHNVRNDMAIVMGIGEQLKTRDDEELVAHGKTMNRTARGLTRVSEKAIEVNRMFEEPVAEQRVQLPATIGGVVSQLAGDYPDATVQTSIDVETVRTDRRIFRKVLEEVVANALEHAGSAPTVRIECARREADLELTVADDGPGIPESELDPVVCGEVTALEHASSLGLWFVNWGTQALGGTVDITTTEAGTQVTVRIPDSVQAGGGRNETRESPLVT
jgi:signal transduction histidine kinase